MSTDLGRAARRGGIVTLGSQGLRLVVQLVGLSVLGRLLAPHDYGLVAIVTVLVSAGEVFRDFGLSAAAIQAKTLSRGQRDNLFWVNTGIGVLLAVLLCSASPLLAAVYDDDRLVLLAVVMSSVFVLNGVSTQFRAGLARDLSFGRLSGAELTGQVTGVAAAVTAAALGAGYWALAVQWISAQLVALVLVVAWSRWLPRWVDRTASIRSFLGFGSALLGSTLLNNSVNYVSPLALGLTTSPAAVGIYNRAQQLVTMPMTQIQAPTTRVALPVLSRLQHEPVRYSQMLLRGQLLLLTLLGLVFATLFAQAPAAVRVLLGPQWGATVPLFRLLLIAGFFQAATYAANWVFQSRALTGSQLRYSLATRPAFVVLIAVGAFWGPAGTAIAYTVCTAIAWPLSLLWLRRATDVPTGRMFGNGVRTGVLSVAAACASFGATHVLDMPALLDLVVGGLATLATAALAVAAFPSTRREARAALTTARRRLRRGRGAASSATVPPATVPPATEPVTTAPLTTAPEETVKSPRPASRSLRRLQNVAVRTWFSSGVPTALDRRAVRRAHRLAVRSVSRGDRGHHLVLAAPGEGNLGDQALLESLLEGTGLPVLLAVPHGQVPDLPDALRERVELVDAPHLLYGGGASHRASVRAYGAALARSSHVSLIGADVMDGTYSLPASVRRASAVTAAARTGAGTRVIGFSWSPTPRPAAVKELRRAARAGVELLVRDPVSLARLQRDGVGPLRQVADVVFSARTVDASAADALLPEGGSGWAVVNASGLIARRADLLDDYVTVVRGLRSRGLRVLLLPHVLRSGTDDLVACRALRDRLEPGEVEVVEHLLTPAQVRGVARRAEVVVTGRMHLAVMSLMAGVPAITLATQGKVEGLTQLAGEPRLAVAPVAGFAGTVLGLVDEVLAPDSPVRRSVRSSLPALRHLAEQNLAGLEGDLPREPVLVGSQER